MTLSNIMNLIKADLAHNAPMTWPEIIENEITLWRASKAYKWMQSGQRYYDGQHDILSAKRTAIDDKGQLRVSNILANNRITHPFLRELADQKAQYLLGRPFSIQTDNEALGKHLNAIFNSDVARMLRTCAKDAVCAGIGWLHVYYDEAGAFKIKHMKPDEIIPFWADADHTELDAVIRCYKTEEYRAREKMLVEHAELWTTRGVQIFKKDHGRWEDAGTLPHIQVDGHGHTWDAVPFIPIKYGDEGAPLIRLIKALIDEYDRTVSADANTLEDMPNSVIVLHGAGGVDADELRRNLSLYRLISFRDVGSATTLNKPLDVSSTNMHIERLRRDIYAFGRGVDTRSERFGSSTSGIAMKYEYAQLDLDAGQLESEIQAAFGKLKWFIIQHLRNTGQGIGEDEDATLVLSRDIIINEAEAIQMCVSSKGIVSDKTIRANHPWTKDVDEETRQMEAEQQKNERNTVLPVPTASPAAVNS